MRNDRSALEKAELLQARTKQFALRVLRLFQALPKREDARILGRQFLRSATSVGANYRAACRARSRKEFASRIGIVVEEIDETVFWFELMIEGAIVPAAQLRPLHNEASQLLAIFPAAHRTARKERRAEAPSSITQ